MLTVPRKLAKIAIGIAGVRGVEPPHELKAFPHFMAWHPRLSDEPAHSWFRDRYDWLLVDHDTVELKGRCSKANEGEL